MNLNTKHLAAIKRELIATQELYNLVKDHRLMGPSLAEKIERLKNQINHLKGAQNENN